MESQFKEDGDDVELDLSAPRLKNQKSFSTVKQPNTYEIRISDKDIKDEETTVTTTQQQGNSPRSRFIMKKFKTQDFDETVLENYACAANCKILLQGMLYVTNQNVYFYSPFNEKTLIGHGTKIKISYKSISHLKKENNLVIFPNSIRFYLDNGNEIVFTSFVSRDTCFSLILKQLTEIGKRNSAAHSLQSNTTKAELVAAKVSDVARSAKSKLKNGRSSKKQRQPKDTQLITHSTSRQAAPINQLIHHSQSQSYDDMEYEYGASSNTIQILSELSQEQNLNRKESAMILESEHEEDLLEEEEENDTFLAGCAGVENDSAEFKLICAERLALARKEIRDFDNFEWPLVEKTIKGVTLKHVLDHLAQYNKIEHEPDCPTPSVDPIWFAFHDRGKNINQKYNPLVAPKLPEAWNDWHKELTAEEFKNIPVKSYFNVDLEHVATDPVPFQPAKTSNVIHYTSYLVSPSQCVIFLKSVGTGYLFCDKFDPEQRLTFTQTMEPGAMQEPDPVKRLQMFSVKLEILGRIELKKFIPFGKGILMDQNQLQQRGANTASCGPIVEELQESIKLRLAHYLDPSIVASLAKRKARAAALSLTKDSGIEMGTVCQEQSSMPESALVVDAQNGQIEELKVIIAEMNTLHEQRAGQLNEHMQSLQGALSSLLKTVKMLLFAFLGLFLMHYFSPLQTTQVAAPSNPAALVDFGDLDFRLLQLVVDELKLKNLDSDPRLTATQSEMEPETTSQTSEDPVESEASLISVEPTASAESTAPDEL